MATKTKVSLYKEVVNLTNEYFGPAADRFLSRQIRNHLHKEPNELLKKDLASLIAWIKLAMSLLTDDEQVINDYVSGLERMTKGKISSVRE